MIALPEASVPSGGMDLVWATQARQYPRSGPPGIHYFRGVVMIGRVRNGNGDAVGRVRYEVDNLLYRSRKGSLVGVLQFYPEDAPMGLEQAGNMNVWVHPRRLRRGIALALITEADRRWGPIDWGQQAYTPEGRALVARYLEASA